MNEFAWIAVAVFLFAGTIKGVVGIGLPVTAIGILSQIADPRLAVVLAIFPIFAANIWQVFRAGNVLGALRRYWVFALLLSTVLLPTSLLAPKVPIDALVIILGVMIVLFALQGLFIKPPPLPDRFDRMAQVAGGILSGIAGGLTAIWAPPMVMYLLSRRIDKEEFVRATGVLFLCGGVPLLVGYLNNGLIDFDSGKLSALLIIPTLAGFTLGEFVRRRLDGERFRTVVLVIFLLMGLNLLRRGIF